MTHHLTPYQQLATVRATTGCRITLQEFEELKGVMDLGDTYLVLIDTAKYSARPGGGVITATGVKRVTIARTPGGWGRPVVTVTWLDTDTVTRVVADPPASCPQEKRRWEELCYRPGTAAHPRDSHARQIQGY